MIILERGPINLTHDSEFRSGISSKSYDFDKFISEFTSTKLLYIDEGLIYISTVELSIVITPSGKVYAGENASGQMTEWQTSKLGSKKSI